jgi:hypothetical protein
LCRKKFLTKNVKVMKKRNLLFILFILFVFSNESNAQGSDLYGSGLKIKFNDDGNLCKRKIEQIGL